MTTAISCYPSTTSIQIIMNLTNHCVWGFGYIVEDCAGDEGHPTWEYVGVRWPSDVHDWDGWEFAGLLPGWYVDD